jgi:hypothetical protein
LDDLYFKELYVALSKITKAFKGTAQRLALAAWGGSVDSPPKREKLTAE